MDNIYGNEGKLVDFTENFHDRLAADPLAFGTTAERLTEYKTTRDYFVNARRVALATDTRTKPNIELKDAHKKTLINSTRSLIKQIQARPETTDAQRDLLGIPVPDRNKTVEPPPSQAAQIELVTAVRRTVRMRVKNPDGGRRRPAGCAGAQVFYAVGELPVRPTDWRSAGLWTSGTFDVAFPDDTPAGSTVWVSAAYYNRKGQYGPMADAVTTNLPGGQVSRTAA